MSSAAAALLLVAIVIVFVGAIALLVALLDRLFGELIRKAWSEVDRRAADRSTRTARKG